MIAGAAGATKLIGLLVCNTSQVPSVFLTAMLNVPFDKFGKVSDACQFKPPSMLYSKVLPIASTTIIPFGLLQSSGEIAVTFTMFGATGSVISVGVVASTGQLPSIFLTKTL